MMSHLTVLIKRVKAIPPKLRQEPVYFSKLVNLAEYMRYNSDFTDFEKLKAIAILKANKMDYLLDIDDDSKFEEEIKKLEVYKEKGYSRTCIRCGRTLTRPESIRLGYGPECFAKVGIPLDKDLTEFMPLKTT